MSLLAQAHPTRSARLKRLLELVRRMGGRIWVDGRDGGGPVFYVELPATSVGASK